MTILPLVIAPDPRLQEFSTPVEEITPSLRTLMDDMAETMYHMNGIGLAAIQVGEAKRILVMDVGWGGSRYDDNGEEHKTLNKQPIFYINPEVIEASEEQNEFEEGCLSFPGQFAKVTRPKTVKIKYMDYHGKEHIEDMDQITATCIQHEMDHLNGIVFVDHVSKMKRDMIIRKLKKIKRYQDSE